MLGRAAAAVTGLGLVGGAGAVVYDGDGTAKVTVTDKQGHTETVEIEGDGGQNFICPDGTEAKLEPIDLRAGRIKITIRRVRRSTDAIERRYPGREAPDNVADRYNRLAKRDDRLVDAYNEAIDEHNAVLTSDCEAEKT
jgi:hypothetical protein